MLVPLPDPWLGTSGGRIKPKDMEDPVKLAKVLNDEYESTYLEPPDDSDDPPEFR